MTRPRSLCLLCMIFPLLSHIADAAETRTTQQEERQFYTEVIAPALRTVKQAMPPVPKGWVIDGESPIPPELPELSSGEPGPVQYSYMIAYKRADTVINEMAKLDKAIVNSKKKHDQEQVDESTRLNKALKETEKTLKQAMKQKNKKEEKRLLKKRDELKKQLEALPEETRHKVLKDTEPFLIKDKKVVIRVFLNERAAEFPVAKPFTRPRAAFALRKDGVREGEKGWSEPQTLILYGDWQEVGRNRFTARMKEHLLLMKVQTIAISIVGERSRVDQVLASMDMRSILGLMQ